jgi:hypothetical protein
MEKNPRVENLVRLSLEVIITEKGNEEMCIVIMDCAVIMISKK